MANASASVKDPFGNHWYIATPTGAVATSTVSHIPEGLHTMMPYLHPQGAPGLIDFFKRAFEAEEHSVLNLRTGPSITRKSESASPSSRWARRTARISRCPPSFTSMSTMTRDAVYRRAVAAGGTSLSEPANQPWGYRNAGVQDPGGNQWWINAPTEEVVPGRGKVTPSVPTAITPIPPGYHAVTPYLKVEEAPKLIDFLKQAFGATEVMRTGDPGGHFHAEVRIGDSIIMMGNAGRSYPSETPMPAAIFLYVEDVDAMYRRVQAGVTSLSVPQDMDWGDRMAGVQDPFGNVWYIATHKKDVPH